ncbi:MAG: phosphocarrier protein NPr [Oceanospirillum sp.]|nr:phosphocarrier protein NPr [Oceanospirillum sp.]
MLSFTVTVCNSKGFHLRPASKLVELVSSFQSIDVILHDRDKGKKADCRNMMALMMMSSPKGTILEFEVDGANEADVAEAIQTLFASGFGDES